MPKKQPKDGAVKPKPLSDKEQAFVNEYLLNPNATQAAIKAGYAPSTADKQAFAWIGKNREDCPANKRHVWDAVKAEQQARSERTKIDADWLLRRLAEEAVADMAELYGPGNVIKDVHDWPLIFRQGLVAGLEIAQVGAGEDAEPGIVTKVKLSDRIKRLELIGRHIGVQAFKDRVEVEASPEYAARLDAAIARAAKHAQERKSAA